MAPRWHVAGTKDLMEYIKQQNLNQVRDKLLTPNSIENADFFRNVWDVAE
ncbi:MAG: hypothetical protein KME29_33830 [Calothrix sp. FI2-JRJ7]|nr:hypothetical protein [Calothrix sp. FI2-JRJ7]